MRVLWITLVTVLVDQFTKVVVLNTMYRGESIPVLGDWLKFTFTENPGMAFGITVGPKALVTIFSLIATALIIFYMYRVRGGYGPYLASLALILGGALGNIVDRVFYGVITSQGEPLFVGRVVDFIHVNLWSGYLPESIPLLGGTYMSLFPIWNVADMAIVCGVVGILFFQRGYHERLHAEALGEAADDPVAAADVSFAGDVPTGAAAVHDEHVPALHDAERAHSAREHVARPSAVEEAEPADLAAEPEPVEEDDEDADR